MEKILCICAMRDLLKALAALEARLAEAYGLTLNEAMVMCSLGDDTLSAGDIVACTGLTASHASKTLRAVEDKGLVARRLGREDKRQMFFALTRKGRALLSRLKEQGLDLPPGLELSRDADGREVVRLLGL